MARIDKYQPVAGGFRAPLHAAYTGAAAAIGVSLNSSGRVVVGAGNTGITGVIVSPFDKAAGDTIDVMTAGEMVEFGGAAGTVYTANTTTGVISNAAASATQVKVGHTVEADRLVVRLGLTTIPATNVVGDQSSIADLVLTSPTDTPATADALRDDLNTNVLPPIVSKINAIIAALEASGLTVVV